MKKRSMVIVFLTLGCAIWFGVRRAHSQARPSHALGVRGGRLADCPDRPNCVSTQTSRAEQEMRPIPLQRSADEAMAEMKSIIGSMARSRIVSASNDYLHAEFRSFLLGFVDDVELWIDEDEQLVHFRSSSRTGHSDLGVNRSRMQEIRQRYESGS